MKILKKMLNMRWKSWKMKSGRMMKMKIRMNLLKNMMINFWNRMRKLKIKLRSKN